MGCSFMFPGTAKTFTGWKTNREILAKEIDDDVAMACFRDCIWTFRQDISNTADLFAPVRGRAGDARILFFGKPFFKGRVVGT